MPILINFVLPLALSILRSYLQNSSTKHDDKLLEVGKDTLLYALDSLKLPVIETEIEDLISIPQFADLKGGL